MSCFLATIVNPTNNDKRMAHVSLEKKDITAFGTSVIKLSFITE